MLKLSRNNQNIKIVGSPPPKHSAIGNIHRDILLLGIITYNMSFKTIADRFNGAFWWYGPLSEDWEKFLTNLPKLSYGFKLYIHYSQKETP